MDSFISIAVVAVEDKPFSGSVVKNARFIEGIRSLTADELLAWPTGLSVVEVRRSKFPFEQVYRYVSTSSVSAVQASVNSAVAGVASSGQVALVAGTKVISIPGLTTANKGFISLVASNTGSSTVTYQAVCTADTLTLRANVAAGTINVADVSTVNYSVL